MSHYSMPYALPSGSMDDIDEIPRRILTDREFSERLRLRADIAGAERNARSLAIEATCEAAAVALGVWLLAQHPIKIMSDFPGTMPIGALDGGSVGVLPTRIERRPPSAQPPRVVNVDRRTLHRSMIPGRGGSGGGSGNPRARVARIGLAAFSVAQIFGRAVSGDPWGKGGFAANIDQILAGASNGISRGTYGTASARRGPAQIGTGIGDGGSGMGGDGDAAIGIDDLFAPDAAPLNLAPRTREVCAPSAFVDEKRRSSIVGGRSRSEIDRVVRENLQALRYAYSQVLRTQPQLRGKVVLRFAIDEFGRVIFCEIVETTMNNPAFEREVAQKVQRWAFEKVDKPGDVTEVTYPFVFSM